MFDKCSCFSYHCVYLSLQFARTCCVCVRVRTFVCVCVCVCWLYLSNRQHDTTLGIVLLQTRKQLQGPCSTGQSDHRHIWSCCPALGLEYLSFDNDPVVLVQVQCHAVD